MRLLPISNRIKNELLIFSSCQFFMCNILLRSSKIIIAQSRCIGALEFNNTQRLLFIERVGKENLSVCAPRTLAAI